MTKKVFTVTCTWAPSYGAVLQAYALARAVQGKHELFSFHEKGLSRSRNRALDAASADICMIADDDMYYEDDYEDTIRKVYDRYLDADIIAFHVASEDIRQQKPIRKEGRLNRITSMKVASWQITFRRESIVKSGVRFDEDFGAGTETYMGEENILLYDCIRGGLKVYYVPEKIATLRDDEASTWFEGFNAKYFYTIGKVYRRMAAALWPILITQFAVRKYKLYSGNLSFAGAMKQMLAGARSAKKG